ncbi:MAG: protoheme IX farnesyltransferase [Deltaproteobacteria bacterium]|nr:protoheme IX farnesyltransferase [Deltaproteobacteria bacterium]
MNNGHPLIGLCKIRIAVFSTLSAASGFMLAAGRLDWKLIVMMTGVFLLSCGACALNQYQERDIDMLMLRTKSRPIPSGRTGPLQALHVSAALISSGLFVLLTGDDLVSSGLGMFAIFWYNGVYTTLKRKTAFAAIPGSLVGAIPPAIGWIYGGGAPSDPRMGALCFFFFMWQVPHSWLVQLAYGADYERAGLPSLLKTFSREQVLRITFIWIFAAAIICLLIPLYGMVVSRAATGALVAAALWVVSKATGLLRGKGDAAFAFGNSNKYILIVMLLLFCDRLFILL